MILAWALAALLVAPMPRAPARSAWALAALTIPSPHHCVTSVTRDPRLGVREVWLYDVKERCEEFEPECVSTLAHLCRPVAVSLGTWDPLPLGYVPDSMSSVYHLPEK